MRTTTTMIALTATTLALAACNRTSVDTGAPLAGGRTATAMLVTATGAPAGRATATEVAGGIRITADVMGLAPGTHGIHIHTVGSCTPPDFASAGGHWNPTAMK
ncbi:MAG TPA: superoxide dismutase family protein, partial [Sphingomonas sp.]|nr:superoxide dismutase family protein [Sphingomonas sp.]